MKLVLETHSHTIASAHAYSTVNELAQSAADKGLALLAVTDHAPSLSDSSPLLHFKNYHVLPRTIAGVEMLYGVELNIMDYDGTVDMPEDVLRLQQIVIASIHTECFTPGTAEQNTNAYLRAMENPYVHIIGHPDDGYIPVDYEALVRKAKEQDVLLEVNNASLETAYFRLNTKENARHMLRLCKEMSVHISVASDAHHSSTVGWFDGALQALEDVGFPEELVANTSVEKFKRLLAKRNDRRKQG